MEEFLQRNIELIKPIEYLSHIFMLVNLLLHESQPPCSVIRDRLVPIPISNWKKYCTDNILNYIKQT